MIELKDVSKVYPDNQPAVKNFSLTVADGETVVLIGSSGCGKTTTLKMINRLIEPTSGEIYINAENILKLSPVALRRDIGYVIQQIGLFPHMTIRENVEIVPSLLGWPEDRRRSRSHELMSLVGLAPDVYSDRFPHELSGGQQQRVGVARALAADPPTLLMDEPFGALDPITRRDIQEEFQTLKREIKKTIVFVTHDIIEAVTLGDRIAVMNKGKLIQLGSAHEILSHPANPMVEKIIGHQRFQLTLSSENIETAADTDIATVSAKFLEKPVEDARNLMRKRRTGILPVVDEQERVVGVLTDERLSRANENETLNEVIQPPPHTIDSDTSLLTALNLMIEKDVQMSVLVNRDGKFGGILSRKSLLGTIANLFDAEGSDSAKTKRVTGKP